MCFPLASVALYLYHSPTRLCITNYICVLLYTKRRYSYARRYNNFSVSFHISFGVLLSFSCIWTTAECGCVSKSRAHLWRCNAFEPKVCVIRPSRRSQPRLIETAIAHVCEPESKRSVNLARAMLKLNWMWMFWNTSSEGVHREVFERGMCEHFSNRILRELLINRKSMEKRIAENEKKKRENIVHRTNVGASVRLLLFSNFIYAISRRVQLTVSDFFTCLFDTDNIAAVLNIETKTRRWPARWVRVNDPKMEPMPWHSEHFFFSLKIRSDLNTNRR